MPITQTSTLALWNLLALLVPVGLALLAVGAAREERAEQVASTALLALASAALGYWLCGFAFQFGGVAFVSGLPGLQSLTAEWSPLDLVWGSGWGLLGFRGFLLSAESYDPDVYALFYSHLATVTTVVLIVLLTLGSHIKRIVLLAIGLLASGFVYPLVGNWVWGGGWLANLGLTVNLGHGYVDAAGAGPAFLLGVLVALGALMIIRPRRDSEPEPARLPPVHFPLLMVLGSLLAWVGWSGLILGNPLIASQVAPAVVVLNLLLAAAGAGLAVSIYSWFVTTQPNAMAIGRGVVAGMVATSAACPFIPSWAALLSGAIGGMLFLLGLYVWEQKIHLDDPSGMIATLGAPAIWGVLVVGLFADGRWGAGWNTVGVEHYMSVPGQGVSGLLAAPGLATGGSGQLQAQLVGLGGFLLGGWLLPWLTFQFVIWLQVQSRKLMTRPVAPVPSPTVTETAFEPEPAESTDSPATPVERVAAEAIADDLPSAPIATHAQSTTASDTAAPKPTRRRRSGKSG
jgi:Amt family ammonium transporter